LLVIIFIYLHHFSEAIVPFYQAFALVSGVPQAGVPDAQ
jgi:hypothetical protein